MAKTTVQGYYHHARSLGAFTAEDCLRMAREAAALDEAAASAPPAAVCWETLPDGTATRLSFTVKVF